MALDRLAFETPFIRGVHSTESDLIYFEVGETAEGSLMVFMTASLKLLN